MTVNTFDPNAATATQPSTTHPTVTAPQMGDQANGTKIGFVSLGCPKNLVDSERILTQLRIEGYDIINSYAGADLVIVNTCGFIDSAVQESLDTIGEALAENGKVLVTGCLGAKEDEIRQIHPKVLGITGPHAYEMVLEQVHQLLPKPEHNPMTSLIPDHGVKLTPRHYAYLKISEGCDHKCTFCIIPSMRGELDSRPIGNILDEAKRLKEAGVKELLVISQDTGAYGTDVKHKTGFWNGMPVKTALLELATKLAEFGIWVRLHYVYPYPNIEKLMPLMAEGKILPYLDVPLQHAAPSVLKRMKRPGNAERTLEQIQRWREICPDLVIRSTFIVGFPGETEEEFEQLLDFIEAAQLDRVGCFKYSPVEGAKANELDNPVSDEIAEERFQRFMALQAEISRDKLQDRIGQEMLVLVDEIGEDGAIGRSYADAPEIDGKVTIGGEYDLNPGDMVWVAIEYADDHDLFGTLVEDDEEEEGEQA
ncbi:30S ribosomal protein S12 methylthiotransferase RimO [Ferrimonas senticii]|uniref:30S ribosomal protein S12 methylthiotransferase RimO n=1 Tax=Ferrimonas senticii TaxID=394566 RepID=UPI00042A449F|nr:30S ribosomal protein S12 methylthiotransferase RimO [Ferrimonas senticii]